MTPKTSKPPASTPETPILPPAAPEGAAPTDSLSIFTEAPFDEILQDLENLLSQSRLAFLIGAGCSHCAGLPLMDQLTKAVLSTLEEPSLTVLKAVIQNFDGAPRCTIEDYMSELVDLIALAERRKQRSAEAPGVKLAGVPYTCEQLAETLDAIKRSIAAKIAHESITSMDVHRRFVRAVHNTLRSGRGSGAHTNVDYFTLNYDTLFEDALALERVQFADGFAGGSTGWWNISRYDDATAAARVFKLHGSIDWCSCDGDILPRRIRTGLAIPTRENHLLIWPAATKYRETQRDPYAQLVYLMRKALRPLANTETVLGICGYAFADEHINAEIDRALRESNERLTVLVFTSDDKPMGQLSTWLEDASVSNRVRIHANRGFFHANDRREFESSIPWWKFEVLTQLLSGNR